MSWMLRKIAETKQGREGTLEEMVAMEAEQEG